MKKKVLVVEDNEALRDLIVEIVQGLDVRVAIATQGKSGWLEFKESRPYPDLVITDLEMETKDAGLVLARQIKTTSPTPVIMITGRAEEMEGMKGKGVDIVFSKPFDIEVLRKTVHKFLEGGKKNGWQMGCDNR